MFRRTLLPLAAFLLLAPTSLCANGAEDRLDWSAWEAMPVLDAGRIMPLDTFARSKMQEICGRANPWLGLAGAEDGDLDAPEVAAARAIFPDGHVA